MTRHGFPSFDLSIIFIWDSSSHIVSTIPLKSSSWIILVNPSFLLPNTKRLWSTDSKKITWNVIKKRRKLNMFKPILREFILAICHIFSTKDTSFKHFFGSKLWMEIFTKILSHRSDQFIRVSLLHFIIDNHCMIHNTL